MEINFHMETLLSMQYIYISCEQQKSKFYVDPYKNFVTVSMNIVAFPNLDVKVWTWKMICNKGVFYVS